MTLTMQQLTMAFGKRIVPVLKHNKVNAVRVSKVTRGIKHLTIHLQLSVASDLKVMTKPDTIESLALACNVDHLSAIRHKGILRLSLLLPESYHTPCVYGDTSGNGFGFTDSNRQIGYTFDDIAPQILVVGSPGSGKNFTAAAMMLSIARSEEARFIICDPHNQFYPFSNWTQLDQPIAQTDSSIARNVDFAYERYLKRHGLVPSEIAPLERVVLVVDEFENKITDSKLIQRVKELVNGGRKYKVNCIIISQKPTEKEMGGMLANLTQIYLGKVKSKGIGSYLSGWPGLEANKLASYGDFYQIMGGEATRFQVAKVEDRDFDSLERGEQSFGMPNLPKEVQDMPVEDINVDMLHKKGRVGRPSRKLSPDVIAYLMANPNVTVRTAVNSMGINNESYYAHKGFVDELARTLKLVYNMEICEE